MIQNYLCDCHGAVVAHPDFNIRVSIFYSALAVYHSPSDISGISGLRREHIRATPSWRKNQPRYDCVFVYSESSIGGRELDVARVMAIFSFIHDGKLFSCALVHEFAYSSRQPDKDTGLWIVVPKFVEGCNHVSESSTSIEYFVQPISFPSTKHVHSFCGHSQWTRHWMSSSASISTSLLITSLSELLYEQ